MAATPVAMSRTTLGTGSATLYTVPGSKTAVVTNIVIVNADTVSRTATVNLDGVAVVSALSLPAQSVTGLDMTQVLTTGKLIAGLASVASMVTIHISGVEF